ncbi:MAG: hypothetical protein Q8R37_03685, partial [Nanoarchaeota archaeon]|nr:hypothetical protein [Nanoarchaeota archaeon]
GTCAVTSADPRLTSCPAGQNCGSVSDGCEGIINCGTCTSPNTCTGGGTINVCGYTPPTCESFTYSAWGACQSNSTQTRTITASGPTGCTGGNPETTSRTCSYTPPTCTPTTWTPDTDPATVACGTSFNQTNGCTTQSVAGTKCTGCAQQINIVVSVQYLRLAQTAFVSNR